MKCVIRGCLISLGSRRKKQNSAEVAALFAQIRPLELAHKQTLAVPILAELQVLRDRLSSLLQYKQKKRLLVVRSKFYEWGNKPGRMLARALRAVRAQTRVLGIDEGGGRLVRRSEEIANQFSTYYQTLYNSTAKLDSAQGQERLEAIRSYLTSSGMPKFSNEQATQLDMPLTPEELASAVKTSKPHKAPGPDGFSLFYYKSFLKVLSAPFLSTFNSILEDASFPQDSLRARIAVIPKEGKDPTQCGSYRPISLLNVDVKLFTKILASRLQPFLGKIIHPDQVGFVSNREAKDNTVRALNAIQSAQSAGTQAMILSTDAEKAFDRVDWAFLKETIAYLGLGVNFRKWVNALYSSPTAVVRVNGVDSPPFHLSNGTRQGCPLSPLIFILSLEPFLCHVRNNGNIHGLQIGSSKHVLAGYADDLLFFITDPLISLPNLLTSFRQYGLLSNLRINWGKSAALNISLPHQTVEHLQKSFPFAWARAGLTYLGIKLSASTRETYQLNFPPFLSRVRQDLAKWGKDTHSWFGRNSILKMTLLPKLLYLLQTLPIPIPPQFLRMLRTEFSNFLWAGKHHRLNRTLMTLPKDRGGVGFPDPVSYHRAVHYARILDWCKNDREKSWVQIEQAMSPIPLSGIPWLGRDCLGPVLSHPLIGTTVQVTRGKSHMLHTEAVTRMLPILGNPAFPPGLEVPFFQRGRTEGRFRLGHFLSSDGERLIPNLRTMWDPPLPWWKALQLGHFLRSIFRDSSGVPPRTPFEELCDDTNPIRHGLAVTYALLSHPPESLPSTQSLKYLEQWESDLNTTFSDKQKRRILLMAHKSSISSKIQENSFKIVTRWYWVPQKIHRVFPDCSALCWRCQKHEGSFLHIFWSCPRLAAFWSEVRRICFDLTETQLGSDPAAYLLHLAPVSTKIYKKSLLHHLLNAAKMCIPLYWKQSTPPPIGLWLTKIKEIYEMEDLMAAANHQESKFRTTWYYWVDYTTTQEYRLLLAPSAAPSGLDS